MRIDKGLRIVLVLLAAVVLFLAFILFMLIDFTLGLAFAAFLGFAILLVWDNTVEFARHFHDVPREDAGALVFRLVGLLPEVPPFKPILRVQDGRANPDGPPVLFKVGGPGYLSIAHNSAAVTSRLGKLHRVFGPGFHKLAPFERLWDVIDLRPQHRRIRVEFMTSDGIPAYCDAEVRFRVAGAPVGETASAGGDALPKQPYRFSKEAVLKLATDKFVTSREGTNRISDWCTGLAKGALDGEMRDALEKYSLDDFLNPRYWEAHNSRTIEQTSPPPAKPISLKGLKEIEADIEKSVRETGENRGIAVDWVRLEPVLPAEEAISRQWLEFWQARSYRDMGGYILQEEEKRAKMLEAANVAAQVELVTGMFNKAQELLQKGITVPRQLILASFVDVIRTLSDQEPVVGQMMFHQVESLHRIVTAIQENNLPLPPSQQVDPSTGEPLPSAPPPQ